VFQKSFTIVCAILLTATLSFGAVTAQSQPAPAEDAWNGFINSLAVRFNTVAAECEKSDWPRAATVQAAYNDSMIGMVGFLNKKNGEMRAVLVYQGFKDNINELNSAAEIEKMAAGLRSFCELAGRMNSNGLLIGDEQIDFAWSDAEKALSKRFAERASELIASYAEKWEKLEPMLNTIISRLHLMGGNKYILIAVKIYNPNVFGASERWVVALYPMEEINDKNLDAKVRDALDKITAYLTEQPYLKVSGVE